MDVFRPGGLELTEKAADIIELKAGERVLDIGCGLGSSLSFLRDKYGIEPYGVDICPETVRRARAKLGVDRISCADALALPFEAGSFDAVFMECVLSLIPQTEKALSEAARVLRKGGRFVISSLEGGEELCAQGRMGKEPLLLSLRAKGFEIISLSDECPALRQFLAEIIFSYDSIENYRQAALDELGGAVLDCSVPVKGTGYILITAIKN